MKLFASPRQFFTEYPGELPAAWLLGLAAVWGIERNFHALFKRAVPLKPIVDVVSLNLLYGVIFGICMLWFGSEVFAWCARRLGGTVSSSRIRTVLAWSSVPRIPSMLGLFVLFAVEGQYFLIQDRKSLLISSPGLVGSFVLLQLLCSIWSVIVAIVGLSQRSGLSVNRSVAAYCLGGFILLLPLVGSALLWTSLQ